MIRSSVPKDPTGETDCSTYVLSQIYESISCTANLNFRKPSGLSIKAVNPFTAKLNFIENLVCLPQAVFDAASASAMSQEICRCP